MVRRKWIKALYAALASTGLALGQDAGLPPAASGERIVTVQEMDRPAQKCKLLHSWRLPEGAQAYLVRALDSDELITVVETGKQGNSTEGKRQISTRVFHWGKGTTPPPGCPAPPSFSVEKVTARTSAPAASAITPKPLPAPVVTKSQPQIVEVQPAPKSWTKAEPVTQVPEEQPRKTLMSVLRDRKAQHAESTSVAVSPAPTTKPASLPAVSTVTAPTNPSYTAPSAPAVVSSKPTVVTPAVVSSRPAATPTVVSSKPVVTPTVVSSKPVVTPAQVIPSPSPYGGTGVSSVTSSLPTVSSGPAPSAPKVVSTTPYGGRVQTPDAVVIPAKPFKEIQVAQAAPIRPVQTVQAPAARPVMEVQTAPKPQRPDLFTVPPKPVTVETVQAAPAPKVETTPANSSPAQYVQPQWSDDVLKRLGEDAKPAVKAEPTAPAKLPEIVKAVETVQTPDPAKAAAAKTVEPAKPQETTKALAPPSDWRQSWGKPEARTAQAADMPKQAVTVEQKPVGLFQMPHAAGEKKAESVQWPNMTRGSEKKVTPVDNKPDLPHAEVARPDPLRNPAGYSKSPAASELSMPPTEQKVTPVVSGAMVKEATPGAQADVMMPPGTPLGTRSVMAAGQDPSQVQFVPVPIVTVPDVQNMPAPPPAQVPRAPQPILNAPRVAAGSQGILPNAFSQPHEMPPPELTPPGPPMANAFTPSGAAPAAGGPGILAQARPGMMPSGGPGMLPPQAYSGPAGPVMNAGYRGPMPYGPAMTPAGMGYPMATPATMPHAAAAAPAQAATSMPDLMGMLRDALLPSQREWAAEQMAMTNWQANPQVVTVLATGAQKDPAPMVRAACCRSLAKLKVNTPEVMAALHAGKADADPRVQHEATQALTALGTTSSAVQPTGFVVPK